MLAQLHCATCRCRRTSAGQTIGAAGKSPIPQFCTPITIGAFKVPLIPRSETAGICGIKFCIMHTVLFTWQDTIWE